MAPISKNGNPYYTQEQYRYARYNTSALEYAQSQGYELVKDGSYYHLKDHDSMIFTPRGGWFWNSRGVSGGALEFQIYYEGKTITEAVLALAEGRETERTAQMQHRQAEPEPRPPFQMPEKSDSARQIFGYLCGARKLDRGVVQEMLRQGVLYESIQPTRAGKEIHNACFVYYDPQGEPCGAYQRGTGSVPFKKESPGSNKSYGWLLRGSGEAKTVMVFEAAIDAASFSTLMRRNGYPEKSIDYLALGGVGDEPLENYLKANPEVKQIYLALDADEPGRKAAQRIGDKFQEKGYTVADATEQVDFAGAKDWNERLQRGNVLLPEMELFQAPPQAAQPGADMEISV